MIVEVTRLMDRWLQQPTHGVGAQLALLQRDTPEGTTDPLPVVPVVYNDVEDNSVVSEIDPPVVPALVLYTNNAPRVNIRNPGRAITQSLSLVIVYVTRDVVHVDGSRDGAYVLKAVKKSLVAFNSEKLSADYRRLNNVKILAVDSVSQDRVTFAVGKSQIWGFVIAELSVIED